MHIRPDVKIWYLEREAEVVECLSSWFAEQEVRGPIPGLTNWISEIGYLLHSSRDMAEILLMQRKSSIQPIATNQIFRAASRIAGELIVETIAGRAALNASLKSSLIDNNFYQILFAISNFEKAPHPICG